MPTRFRTGSSTPSRCCRQRAKICLARYEFSYAHVNEPIAPEAFQVPTAAGVERQPFKLEEGYDHFFVKACDGSDGRMSASWGQQGPKGSSNSGIELGRAGGGMSFFFLHSKWEVFMRRLIVAAVVVMASFGRRGRPSSKR